MQSTYKNIFVLTGIIGAGKSTVAALLSDLGCLVIDADELARKVVLPGTQVLKSISERFGNNVINPDGTLNRNLLGQIVFNDPIALADLGRITHPQIQLLAKEEFEAAINNLKSAGLSKPIIYDCPLFFEAGLNSLGFKGVILIVADNETCIKRIMNRDHLSKEEAKRRISTQIPISEKIKYADFIVDNSGTLEELKDKVSKLYKEVRHCLP